MIPFIYLYAIRIMVGQYYVRQIHYLYDFLQYITEAARDVAWQAVAKFDASMHLFLKKK